MAPTTELHGHSMATVRAVGELTAVLRQLGREYHLGRRATVARGSASGALITTSHTQVSDRQTDRQAECELHPPGQQGPVGSDYTYIHFPCWSGHRSEPMVKY